MGDPYKPPSHWGCLVAFIAGMPLLLLILLVAILNGGRCEAMPQPCHGNDATTLVLIPIVLAGCFGLAWMINNWINRPRR